MEQIKREEVIFDASIEVYGVYRDELSDRDIDSRDVFEEIRKFADFWMKAYEPLLGTVIDEDAYLEYVTLAALCWMKGYLGHYMTDDDELMLCNNQRVAQYVREHKMTLYDYDCWSNLEEVIGEPLTYEEFHKLNAEILDDPMSIAVCEGNRKDLKAKLEYIRKPKEMVPVYLLIKNMVKGWIEVPVGAGREEVVAATRKKFMNNFHEFENDIGWDNDESDILEYNIDWDGVQEV